VMEPLPQEKRHFERLVFSYGENSTGLFSLLVVSGREISRFHARILDISGGGMRLAVKKEDGRAIKVGDRISFKQVLENERLSFCTDVELEVSWIIEAELLTHVAFGCQYRNLPDALRDKIIKFVDSEIRSRSHQSRLNAPHTL